MNKKSTQRNKKKIIKKTQKRKSRKKDIKQTFGGHKSVLKIVSGVFFRFKLLQF